MKLIPLIILTLSAVVNVQSNEHFTFPPQFHPHGPGIQTLSPDRTVYLPPEGPTPMPMPYFPMKNINLQFPYLPTTATKAPTHFSTPYPMMMSSTMRSMVSDDDTDDDDDDDDKKPAQPIQNNNRTQINTQLIERKREMRPKQMNYQPIDRIDMKFPMGFSNNRNEENGYIQKATPRSMVISVPDNQKNDAFDQYKSAAFHGPSFIAAPNIPGVYLSSTTETAVPIIRLSNEMDLDGSFSYEALGADQTHYVQHSRMDSLGNEKQEQVVEGSYSYVGDNGQTYTVNYIADSNGFRASGDHLPVAPPIPEIIQRSIQYNLAEEAKKPPHMRSWNGENELGESENTQRYTISPPTPRNLFTGKTPESFSFAFAQGVQNTQNNLVPAASNQNPIKANVDFTLEQMKGKTNNGISPQITFLASQGAHAPSTNPQQTVQTVGRVFTTERSILPQLMNYEAGIKDSDESNEALWRWQYGLNSNINRENSEKNSISRSFGEGDDVMINFSDMSPQQYTSMIKSQLGSNNDSPQNNQSNLASVNMKKYYQQNYYEQPNNMFLQPQPSISSTEKYYDVTSQALNWKQNSNQHDSTSKLNHNMVEISNNAFRHPQISISSTEKYYDVPSQAVNSNQNYNQYDTTSEVSHNVKENSNVVYDTIAHDNHNKMLNTHYVPDTRAKLVTKEKLIPPSQTVTQAYNYEDMVYEPQRIRPSTLQPLTKSDSSESDSDYKQNNYVRDETQNILWSKAEPAQVSSTIVAPTTTSAVSSFNFMNLNTDNKKNAFKPVYKSEEVNNHNEITTTTEISNEDIIRDNIFLRNLYKADIIEPATSNKIREDTKVKTETRPTQMQNSEPKYDKSSKFIPVKSKPYNEIQTMKKKPLDIADIMNYISLKNSFEPAKTKPKSILRQGNSYNQRNEMRFTPAQEHYDEDDEGIMPSPSALTIHYYEPDEVKGNIKNYKVLQRNNNGMSQEADQLKRELSPPPVQKSDLPPLGRAGPSMKSYLPPIYV